MGVWVVMGRYAYETAEIVSVWSSQDAANDAADAARKEYDQVDVDWFEVQDA